MSQLDKEPLNVNAQSLNTEISLQSNREDLIIDEVKTSILKDFKRQIHDPNPEQTRKIISKLTSMKDTRPNNSRKNKLNPKKLFIKEFRYCILTDLKIGEGEFSETFQGN